MRITHWSRIRMLAAILPLAGAASAPREARAAEPQAIAASPAGTGEAIQVHGDWLIEIRNADGSVASRHEIKNGLAPSAQGGGASVLAALLGRRESMGGWEIVIGDHQTTNPLVVPQGPCASLIGGVACYISETGRAAAVPSSLVPHFSNLSVSVPEQETSPAPSTISIIRPTGFIHLTGHATAGVDSSFDRVTTKVNLCPATQSPAACLTAQSPLSLAVTTKAFSPAIQVASGQEIHVRVTLSFASGAPSPSTTTTIEPPPASR